MRFFEFPIAMWLLRTPFFLGGIRSSNPLQAATTHVGYPEAHPGGTSTVVRGDALRDAPGKSSFTNSRI